MLKGREVGGEGRKDGRKDGRKEGWEGRRKGGRDGGREGEKEEGGRREGENGGRWEGKKGKEEALLPVYNGQMRAFKCQPVTLKISDQIPCNLCNDHHVG